MNEAQVAEAIASWLAELLGPEQVGSDDALAVTYTFLPQQKGELPDCAVEVAQKRISRGAEERLFFPLAQLQQTVLRVFECSLNFMVEGADVAGMESDENEQRILKRYGALVEASALADASLGGRLETAFMSPVMLFDYRLPFVQYNDGTRGRQATAVVAVGEMVPQQEEGI